MLQEASLEGVVRGIRRRASFARNSALGIIGVLTLIGVGTAFLFVQAVSSPTISIGPQSNLANALIQTGGLDWIPEITKAFIRIGGVIMVVFLINILVSFARYNLRVSNYLDSRADCLVITGGDVEKLSKLLPSVSVDLLDFMKTPMSPYDAYLGAIRGILPSRVGGPSGNKGKSDE